ncbi:MAG: dUTPase [Bacillaceae bacterium]|jgi:dimeric dUTPase (all-alpha-NTP-PPase superfamily)|uniref:dUTPase n=1 Tax=Aeribacillus pallidus TaxID=33936 RepID=A0A165YK98_9BACI|nr:MULTISPECIES: dUTP diphosphatase [Aeribacillus]AXI40298.1 dUTPase [Bacillaceae bacterium ZC4]REJ20712.1 MAG: dUTPase [Bacillaceae bacterium]ASS92116.1 dUTPase [Aeribacillus pallidus]AXI40355.1 dUTPase [Bacillaceae bacterium ZC4]KZN97170.1 dUTPase [Aeribacillus pallidus]
MDFEQLYKMQKELDEKIEKKHGLEEERLIERKVLALLVEIGELANETRCFKFWSVKPPSDREVILEEYVDGLHFLLSIGHELYIEKLPEMKARKIDKSLTDLFLNVYQKTAKFSEYLSVQAYIDLFNDYVTLGSALGFSEEDIISAYMAKNEVNHARQNQGY